MKHIKGSCEHCGKNYIVDDKQIDLNTLQVKCPYCGRMSENWED